MALSSTTGLAEAREAQDTFSRRDTYGSALGLLIIGLQIYAPSLSVNQGRPYSPSAFEGTSAPLSAVRMVDNAALFDVFRRVYNMMWQDSIELPEDDRRLIYDNLWELFG
jgi:hypothetical protein